MRFIDFQMRALAVAVLALSACSVTAGQTDGGDGGTTGDAGAGQACSSDFDCQSGVCHVRCCATPCDSDPVHPECTSCDTTGACVYPQVQCVNSSCDPETLVATQSAICANGVCPTPVTQVCAASCEGATCGNGCRGDQDCAAGDKCVVLADAGNSSVANPVGTCVPQGAGGASCHVNDDCSSGVCIGGVCCNGACTGYDSQHPECTSCDNSGACVYSTAVCSVATCDSVANAYSAPGACSQGACAAPAAVSCGTYQCGATGCSQSCLADLDCASSGFCVQDNGEGRCCAVLVQGSTLYVDLIAGSDTSCCGLTPTTPCGTMGRALEVAGFSAVKATAVGLAPLTRYTLSLTIDGGSGDWQSPPHGITGDSFPFVIPTGVTLHAPSISLGELDLYDPVLAAGTDAGPSIDGGVYWATVEGDANRPVVIGLNRNNVITGPLSISGGGTVNLSNVLIFGGLAASINNAPPVLGGGSVQGQINLGVDGQGKVGGIVQLGWAPDAGPLNGSFLIPQVAGMTMEGDVAVTDFGNPGDSTLRIYKTNSNFSLLVDFGTIATLTHAPLFLGGNNGIGNAGTLNLANATILGQRGMGIQVSHGFAHVDQIEVENNGCQGIRVGTSALDFDIYPGVNPNNLAIDPGGTLHLSNSVITGNAVGVQLDGTENDSSAAPTWEGQLADLSVSPDGGPGGNRIYCNGPTHISDAGCSWGNALSPGVGADVWNSSSNFLKADNVAWGPSQPTIWDCDDFLTAASCVTQAGQPFCDGGLDYLVDDGGVDAGIDDAGPVECGVFEPAAVSTPDPSTGLAGAFSVQSPTQAVTSCP